MDGQVTFKSKLHALVEETHGEFTNRTIINRLIHTRAKFNYHTVVRELRDMALRGELEVVRKATRGNGHATIYRLPFTSAAAPVPQ